MQKNKFSSGSVLRRVIAGAALLVGLMSFPHVSAESSWEIFDTVAGFPMTVMLDAEIVPQLAELDGKKITLLGECPGGTVEMRSYVENATATFSIEEQWTTKAGACTFTVIDHEAKQIANGSSEIFPDVIASRQLEITDGGTLTKGKESEFRAGFFDQYGNPADSQIVLLSSDATIEPGTEDAGGYKHFTVLPERGGEISFTVVETLTGESKRFTFTAEDPVAAAQAQQVAQNPAVGGTQSTVTQLLGELIRASLLNEYQGAANGTTLIPRNVANLIDSFDVVIGDGDPTIRVSEQMDLMITAMAQNGAKVENYVDSIMIETSDVDAVIPTGAIRFKATDRGRKILPLAIMFQTPGEQSVTVRDEADPENILGTTSVWVLGSSAPKTSQAITLQDISLVSAGQKANIEGVAPAYTNLHLYRILEDGEEKLLAETSSDAKGSFMFDVRLSADPGFFDLFVRDSEGYVKDSATITVEVGEKMPVDVPPVVNPPATIIPSVTGLSSGTDGGDVLLRWNIVRDAVRYRIYFGPSAANLSQSMEINGQVTNVRLTGLRAGRTYAFAVTAIFGNGEESTGKSPVVTATLRGPLFDLTAAGIPNGVQLRFVAPPAVAVQAYRIHYGVQSGVLTEERILPPNTTNAVFSDLINGLPYFFSVDALLNDGTALADGAEISATPGQNGMTGIFPVPADPLPFNLNSLQGATSSTVPQGGNNQHAAAPTIPASGERGLWWMISLTLLLSLGGIGVLRFQR